MLAFGLLGGLGGGRACGYTGTPARRRLAMVSDLFAFLIAAVAATTFTPGARRLSISIGLLDFPGPRKLHARPMPVLGGLAVYLATLFAISLLVADEAWSQMLGIFIAATVALVVGMLDDHGSLHHLAKLVVAMPVAAVILVSTGMHSELFHQLDVVPWLAVPGAWLDYALSFVWIIAITSAFSILDHMDGLCAGVAAIACVFCFSIAEAEGQILISMLAATMAGATLGFLRWNFHPARIFLGDGGAMFVGLMMATLGLKLRPVEVPEAISWMVPVLVFLAPIFDTTLVVFSRLRRGLVPFTSPGKDHVAHRLVSWGLTERQAVLTIYAVGIAGGLLALLVRRLTAPQGLTLAAIVAAVGLVAVALFERAPYERQPGGHS